MISKVLVGLFIGKVEIIGNYCSQCIYASNHPRELDVFLLNYVFPEAHIMAADSVMRNLGWILPKDKCFSAKNGIVNALKILKQGKSIAICPSGWTELTGKDLPWKKGFLVISRESKVPIVVVKLEYATCRGEWINKFPTIAQWIINLMLPRKRGVKVIIKEAFSDLSICNDTAQNMRNYTLL